MGATASVPARDSAKRALWERLCSLDDACKAVQSRSGAASEEVRARRRLMNGAQSVLHRLRAALSASEAVDNARVALSARREAAALGPSNEMGMGSTGDGKHGWRWQGFF